MSKKMFLQKCQQSNFTFEESTDDAQSSDTSLVFNAKSNQWERPASPCEVSDTSECETDSNSR